MGEINVPQDKNPQKRKRLSTRVDLTPMVDLGFLLITFFIFTTTMSEPHVMKLSVPKDSNDSTKTTESKTLNFILDDTNRIAYYPGNAIDAIKYVHYNEDIRKVITEKRKAIAVVGGNPDELVILIKPTKGSSYRNIVDILDEMTINQVRSYFLTEPTSHEIKKAADLRVRS